VRALLDIHVIIALFDPDHAFHERAHVWWSVNRIQGWASCPLTENGAVRIMSHPNYSRILQFSPGELISRIGEFADQTDHAFWGDSISLRDEGIFERDRMHSTRQITDLYLLALAVSHQGRLVTFDEGIPISAVRNAKITNLCVL
jgi:toxin-antitoxin system PIN domain toxin